jgi:hypothetical protein
VIIGPSLLAAENTPECLEKLGETGDTFGSKKRVTKFINRRLPTEN